MSSARLNKLSLESYPPVVFSKKSEPMKSSSAKNGKAGKGAVNHKLHKVASTNSVWQPSKAATADKKKLQDDAAKKKATEKAIAMRGKYLIYKKEWVEVLKQEKRGFENRWEHAPKEAVCFEDFERVRTLGHGSFGRVFLVKHKETLKPYALKVMSKKEIVKQQQIEHTLNEKKILTAVNFPFLVSMVSSFKDNANLFLMLEFVNGGEMFSHLVKKKSFSETRTKFYISQVVLAIEYLHSLDILHRDLKPENTLICADGYIKLTDFGFAKVVKTRTYTLCGTPEYLAPEIILQNRYGKAVDYWAVGILTYEMAAGHPPFQGVPPALFEKINSGKYEEQATFSDELKDFLRCMIQVDITKRYGNLRGGVDDIKMHKWFYSIDWMAVYKKKIMPPYVPKVKSADDASNFDFFDEKTITRSSQPMFDAEFSDF